MKVATQNLPADRHGPLMPAPCNYCLLLACDAAYAMPLATMLRSTADANPSLWPLQVTIVTPGLDSSLRLAVEASVPSGAVDFRWVQIDTERFSAYARLSHISSMTFARLVIPDLVRSDVDRVLYLDVDMLMLDSITPLLHTDLRGCAVGAVPDLCVNEDFASQSGDGPDGIPSVRRYFNAGVLLLDMRARTASGIFQRALAYLESNPSTPYSDQDALNVACDECWFELDSRWNFQAHRQHRIDLMPASDRPAIAHFVSSSKPWKPSSASINAALYGSIRDRTAFRRSRRERVWEYALRTGYRVRNRLRRVNSAMRHRSAASATCARSRA